MANPNRCEVPFPVIGEGYYLRFTLGDLTEIENEFGDQFFDQIEQGCARISPKVIVSCLKVGLKSKSVTGDENYVWKDVDQNKIQDDDFKLGDAGQPIMEAISQSWLAKSYDDLIKDAEAARKKQATEQKKALKAAVGEAASVIEGLGLPFDQKASLEILSKMLTEQGLNPMKSGS